jgi:hypothetical protein
LKVRLIEQADFYQHRLIEQADFYKVRLIEQADVYKGRLIEHADLYVFLQKESKSQGEIETASRKLQFSFKVFFPFRKKKKVSDFIQS